MIRPATYIPSIFTVPLFVLILGVFLFVALLIDETALAGFCLALLGVLIGCRVWSGFSAPGVRLDFTSDRLRMFPGDAFSLSITAQNLKLLPVWVQAGIPRMEAMDLAGDDAPAELNAALAPRRASRLSWQLKARQRGVHRLGPSHLIAGDLLGMYPRRVEFTGGAEILVYPRLVPIRLVDLPRREMFGSPGARHPVADPVYLIGTRDYQPGRPARFIHWRASARHNRWQEKLFEPSAQSKVVLAVDVAGFHENQAKEDFERALEVVASLAVEMERRGVQVGFFSNGARLKGNEDEFTLLESGPPPPGPPVWQAENILEALARLDMTPAGPMTLLLNQYPGFLRGASLALCAWRLDQSCGLMRSICQRHGVPCALLLAEAQGEAIPGEGRGVYFLSSLRAEAAA